MSKMKEKSQRSSFQLFFHLISFLTDQKKNQSSDGTIQFYPWSVYKA